METRLPVAVVPRCPAISPHRRKKANVGPGLEIVGPMGNFSSFSPWSKLLLSFDMLVGRLEIFPMLLLFAPSIWKRRLPSRRLVD